MLSSLISRWLLLGTSTLLLCSQQVVGSVDFSRAGQDLAPLREVHSHDGVLDTGLSLDFCYLETPDFQVTLFCFNHSMNTMVIRVKPGDHLLTNYTNNLPDVLDWNETNTVHNDHYGTPFETNLHFHGLVVSGFLPSDNPIDLVLKQKEWYQYNMTLPPEHMSGTHWIHPHRHGSATPQVGGAAAGIFIIDDPPDFLPTQVAEAPEIILMVQNLIMANEEKVAGETGDYLFHGDITYTTRPLYAEQEWTFTIINGQVSPTIRVVPGQWTRLRVVASYAGDPDENMDFHIPGCDMRLLAKDGIYIRDYPRTITAAPIPMGGRADIMLRCMFEHDLEEPKESYNVWKNITMIAHIAKVEGSEFVDSTELEPWTPSEYPSYLQDLRNTNATEGCSCDLHFGPDDYHINGREFDPDYILHRSFLGAVVERNLMSNLHAFHQHVYPYQLVELGDVTSCDVEDDCEAFFKVGDWHDTFMGRALLRYQPNIYETPLVLHCHVLEHEDQGMMTQEFVSARETECQCGGVETRPIEIYEGASVNPDKHTTVIPLKTPNGVDAEVLPLSLERTESSEVSGVVSEVQPTNIASSETESSEKSFDYVPVLLVGGVFAVAGVGYYVNQHGVTVNGMTASSRRERGYGAIQTASLEV